ncbi:type II toxin-antitoxin system VapC family toxin [Ottowia sp.]|uniref:type II toxin-antitoxin system VapC family toxin n=1 Tax=Ottowia sp. TaxID=1898956 RepID=UPI003A8C4DBD
MKLPDTNLLLYATNPLSPHHEMARALLDAAVREPNGVGLAWLPLIGFVRLSTMARVMENPLSVADALADVQGWLDHPNARLLQPGVRHMDILARLLLEAGTAGNLTSDAHIAAIAIEHGAEVITFDKDFARFTGLRYQLLS